MKKEFWLIIVFFGIFVSCRKDVDIITPKRLAPVVDSVTSSKEQFIKSFENYESLASIVTTTGGCCSSFSVSRDFQYKLVPSVSSGEKYFYKMIRKSTLNYCNPQVIDWTETSGYYRYDFTNKLSLYYSDTNDLSPISLMDFNLMPGDSMQIQYGIYFYVVGVGTEAIDGQSFPILYGKMASSNQYQYFSNQSPGLFSVSPYFPNPVALDQYFICSPNHSPLPDDFCSDCTVGFGNDDYFSFELKNVITNSVITSIWFDFNY